MLILEEEFHCNNDNMGMIKSLRDSRNVCNIDFLEGNSSRIIEMVPLPNICYKEHGYR